MDAGSPNTNQPPISARITALVERYDLSREVEAEVAALVRSLLVSTETAETVLPLDLRTRVTEAMPGPRGGFDTDLPTEQAGDVFAPPPEALPAGRYRDRGVIGVGGMGEVRRMFDRRLGRTVAMKLLRADLCEREDAVARFLGEAQVAAQLQHPGLVPVHDVGTLPDGRVWFTMKEVTGRELGAVIDEVHQASTDRWEAGATGWNLRRLLEAFASVCDAVGYAHSRGVVHRDLKPDNIMVGAWGEVLVLDWGIAKILGEQPFEPETTEETVWTARTAADAFRTQMGSVAGTALYMAPEQVRGEIDALDARTDVYALGALLYEILTGTQPYAGTDIYQVLSRIVDGPPPPPPPDRLAQQGRSLPLPEELVALIGDAMAPDKEDRPRDGGAFATLVRAWLEGAVQEERALSLVERARAHRPEAARLRTEATRLRARAARVLEQIPSHAPAAEKLPGWTLEDRAAQLEADADQLAVQAELALGAALSYADLPAIHAELLSLYRSEHAEAEAEGNRRAAARARTHLERHAAALPAGHPERARADRWLAGTGAITLHTDPPGAAVRLLRLEQQGRRWVEVPSDALGSAPFTPLDAAPLPMGRWICEISAPGRATVRYPVHIGRGEHWDGRPPGGDGPAPIELPAADTVSEQDCIVPAGWFIAGGDPAATGSLPRQRLWCDGFVIQRQPVTFAAYLRMLHALVDAGRTDEALRLAPQRRRGSDEAGELLLDFDGTRFTVPAPWTPEHPALMVSWPDAMAYAAWWAEQTGLPWRLPCELEWEKAGRGVDGRLFPWGEHFDPSWACLEDSHAGRACVQPVHAFPADVSPYGVRGLAGNVRDWCLDVWSNDGPPTPGDRVQPPTDPGEADSWRVRRGGSWGDMPGRARMADRDWYHPYYRFDYLGFRLLRVYSAAG